MRIIKVDNYNVLSKRAADIIAAQVLLKPSCVLGLATGATPEGTYQELVRRNQEEGLSFSEVKTVNLDEYKGLSRDSNQSYYYYMNQHLFSHVDISKENTHLPDGLAENAQVECEAYEQLMNRLGGIDLQLLGIGRNGHIGFNEPDESFTNTTHTVALTQSTIDANAKYFESEDKMPHFAFTMGIGSIMRARKILLLANGDTKAQILKEALTGPVTPKVPASILQLHPDVTIVADIQALALFDK